MPSPAMEPEPSPGGHESSTASTDGLDTTEPCLADRINARLKGEFSSADQELLNTWRDASDWKELLNLNRAFLRGEQEFTPYYLGPIHDETRPLVSDLLSLHRYGLFTYQGQPSMTRKPAKYDCCMGCGESKYDTSRQRAYLTFFLPRGKCESEEMNGHAIKRFLDELMDNEHICTAITSFESTCRRGSCKLKLVVRSNFPKYWQSNTSKSAPTLEELEFAAEEGRQVFEVDCACALEGVKSANGVMDHMNPFMVHVLAKSWEASDLLELIESAAKKADLEPIYAENEDLKDKRDGENKSDEDRMDDEDEEVYE